MLKEDACSCGAKYLSVFGTGRAFLIDDKEEKTKALDAIMTKHTGKVGLDYTDSFLIGHCSSKWKSSQ